jgi:OOP family OmpA-OmpF porin
MRNSRLMRVVLTGMLLLLGRGALADISGFVGYHQPSADGKLSRTDSTPGSALQGAPIFGAMLDHVWDPHWSLVGEFDVTRTSRADSLGDALLATGHVNVLFHLMTRRVRPFVLLGGQARAAMVSNPLIMKNDLGFAGEVGAGLKVDLSGGFGLRLDGRALVAPAFTNSGFAPEWTAILGVYGRFPTPDGLAEEAAETEDLADADNDGVLDSIDECPHKFGPPRLNGCPPPDTDGDGVPDEDDKCPHKAGEKSLKGCPDGDRDGDGIGDTRDACPDAAGPTETTGCPLPDADTDTVPDTVDRCKRVPGPPENQGCPWPDADRDGVPDAQDKCPKVAGLKRFFGCMPGDADGDLVADDVDKCPDARGPPINDGCPLPDRDGDGIPDATDKCPDLASGRRMGRNGTAWKGDDGCPDADSDKDGVPDHLDKCPLVPSHRQMNSAGVPHADDDGCPLPDADGDGIEDASDKCPTVASGRKLLKNGRPRPGDDGCPHLDTDKDGVPDEDDKCPTVRSEVPLLPNGRPRPDDNGCPLPDADHDGVPDELDKCPQAASGHRLSKSGRARPDDDGCPSKAVESPTILGKTYIVDFTVGSMDVPASYYAALNEVAANVIATPVLRVAVAGHTDNVGVAANNRLLSQRRAQAIRAYLIARGVPADRVTAQGYGPDRPRTTNDTPEGRAQNRRVEYTIEKR